VPQEEDQGKANGEDAAGEEVAADRRPEYLEGRIYAKCFHEEAS